MTTATPTPLTSARSLPGSSHTRASPSRQNQATTTGADLLALQPQEPIRIPCTATRSDIPTPWGADTSSWVSQWSMPAGMIERIGATVRGGRCRVRDSMQAVEDADGDRKRAYGDDRHPALPRQRSFLVPSASKAMPLVPKETHQGKHHQATDRSDGAHE